MTTFNIRVLVEDVNGDAIKGCHIKISDDSGNTNEVLKSLTGELSLSIDGRQVTDSTEVHVFADHPLFAAEQVNATIAPPKWDLPTARLKIESDGLKIVVVLGRLVKVSTFEIESKRLYGEPIAEDTNLEERKAIEKRNLEKLKNLNKEIQEKHGVLVDSKKTSIGERDHYLAMSPESVASFVTVDTDKNRRRVLTSKNKIGWERFVTKRRNINTAEKGQFWLLKYGDSPKERSFNGQKEQAILVSVYIPDLDAGSTPTERDILVFLTPNTLRPPAYNVPYPDGFNILTAKDKEHPQYNNYFYQPFSDSLGVGYFFRVHYMVHQILAMEKKTILVMPVWRRDGPGVLSTTSGMLRLLREVQHFAHKKSFTGIRRPTANTEFGTGRRSQIIPLLNEQNLVPKLKFGIAAFSQGGDYLKDLLKGNYRKLPDTLLVPGTMKNQEEFSKAWIEVFDIDCIKSDEFDTALVGWKRGDENRGLRLLWTGHTGRSKSDLESKGNVLSALIDGKIDKFADTTSKAHEFQSTTGRFSALVMATDYLKPVVKGDIPSFSKDGLDGTHQFAPTFGLAWALGCSVLR